MPTLKKTLADMLKPAEEFIKEADAAEKEHKKSSEPTSPEKTPASKEQSGGPSKAELVSHFISPCTTSLRSPNKPAVRSHVMPRVP